MNIRCIFGHKRYSVTSYTDRCSRCGKLWFRAVKKFKNVAFIGWRPVKLHQLPQAQKHAVIAEKAMQEHARLGGNYEKY